MSHYTTIVLVPKGHYLMKTVEKLMAPYDENLQGLLERDQACGCPGVAAWGECQKQAEREFGDNLKITTTFGEFLSSSEDPEVRGMFGKAYGELTEMQRARIEPLWEAHIKPRADRIDQLFAAHPDRLKPDSECAACEGKGTYRTDANPKARWDWWVVGGRWDGWLTETHHPGRPQGLNAIPFGQPLSENSVPTEELLKLGSAATIPFALVTPDGEWHQKGRMASWAFVLNEKPMAEWHQEVLKLYKQHFDTIAVMLDCHI